MVLPGGPPPSPPPCCPRTALLPFPRSAEKFGTEYVEPSRRRDLRLDARKERFTRPGFATGIDLFTEEERQKREQRAARFGLPEGSGLEWKPPQVRAARGWGGPWLCRCNATEHSLEWVAWRRAELPALLRRVDAWQVSEDDEKRRQRAERFGVDYKPKDETGLMDVGGWRAARSRSREDLVVPAPMPLAVAAPPLLPGPQPWLLVPTDCTRHRPCAPAHPHPPLPSSPPACRPV